MVAVGAEARLEAELDAINRRLASLSGGGVAATPRHMRPTAAPPQRAAADRHPQNPTVRPQHRAAKGTDVAAVQQPADRRDHRQPMVIGTIKIRDLTAGHKTSARSDEAPHPQKNARRTPSSDARAMGGSKAPRSVRQEDRRDVVTQDTERRASPLRRAVATPAARHDPPQPTPSASPSVRPTVVAFPARRRSEDTAAAPCRCDRSSNNVEAYLPPPGLILTVNELLGTKVSQQAVNQLRYELAHSRRTGGPVLDARHVPAARCTPLYAPALHIAAPSRSASPLTSRAAHERRLQEEKSQRPRSPPRATAVVSQAMSLTDLAGAATPHRHEQGSSPSPNRDGGLPRSGGVPSPRSKGHGVVTASMNLTQLSQMASPLLQRQIPSSSPHDGQQPMQHGSHVDPAVMTTGERYLFHKLLQHQRQLRHPSHEAEQDPDSSPQQALRPVQRDYVLTKSSILVSSAAVSRVGERGGADDQPYTRLTTLSRPPRAPSASVSRSPERKALLFSPERGESLEISPQRDSPSPVSGSMPLSMLLSRRQRA